ncbi:MAG TPA: hypothetical protein PKE54_18680, partial [Candidatus Obscuribacter sp.]|nr:hypothetical protein [Candidatus Obscuribacter sp.]
MSIPTLLVCDGGESRQDVLEKMIKAEPGLKYLATVGLVNGTRAVEQAIKVGGKLIWIDLEDEPDKAIDLIAEVRNMFPQANLLASANGVAPDIIRAALNLGALDVVRPETAAQQLQNLVARINGTAPAAAPAPVPAPAP